MRVLFTTWNSPSHFFPSVPLARALVAAGHEVRVAAPPSCAASIQASGLCPEQVGVDIDVAATSSKGKLAAWHQQLSWPDGWAADPSLLGDGERAILRALGSKQLRIAEAMAPDVVDLAHRFDPALIVHDAGSYAGRVAAAAVGVPSVSHMWGSPTLLRLERHDLVGDFLPGYVELFARFGVAAAEDSTRWLDMCPPSIQVSSPTVRSLMRPEPYNGPGHAPAWLPLRLAGTTKRIAVTWGVSAAQFRPGELPLMLQHALDAAVSTGAEVVLALGAGQSSLLGPLPASVRVVEELPLRLLLPTCDAVVHQGGGGTTMTAVAAGTPQVIVAPRPEQMVTGAQLSRYGAARSHVVNELLALADPSAVLAEDLATLLATSSYAAAATELAREAAAMPSLVAVVASLEALAAPGGWVQAG